MPAEDIKIKVESNLFSDADKIMTAHSYNIALPRTMANDSLFSLAYIAGANTGGISTHRYLTASLYIDGVPLFEGGRAVLTSVDDKGYNLNLFWGLLGVFDEIKREGLNVNELPLSAYWQDSHETNQWLTLLRNTHLVNNPYNSGMSAEVFDTLDSDSTALAGKYPWWMPANDALVLLDLIFSVYGVNVSYSAEFSRRAATLTHISPTLHNVAKGELIKMSDTNVLTKVTSNRYYINWANLTSSVAPTSQAMQNALSYVVDGYDRQWKARLAVNVKSVRVWGSRNLNDWRIVFGAANEDVQIEPTYNPDTGMYEVDHTWYNIKLEAGDTLPLIQTNSGGVPVGTSTLLRMSVVIDECADVEAGFYWSYIRNAPNMGIIDYISEILAHTGSVIVGSVTKPDALRIMTFDEVAQGEPASYEMQGVNSITMALDNLAQRNNYIHAENKDDEAQGLPPYLASGVIYTNDSTLTLDRDAFKSGFKVPRTNKVLHWKVEKNENANTYKATWQDAGDNVLGFSVATFKFANDGQDFATIIANWYTAYEAVVNRPKVVEMVVRLSVLDLLALDMARPVYIAQLGRKYLIESLESDQGENYKLTLVQM